MPRTSRPMTVALVDLQERKPHGVKRVRVVFAADTCLTREMGRSVLTPLRGTERARRAVPLRVVAETISRR